MATHSSIFAWRIPWTEEPGGLQSMGSQRVRLDLSSLARMHSLLTYGILKKKNDRNELIYKTELQCGKQTYGYQMGKGGRINRLGLTHTHQYM